MSSNRRSLRERMQSERGVALFLTLILVTTLSVLTVSMMFLSQSESFASGNYRLMTQARYGAEAGVQKAADFILNTDFGATSPGLMALIPTSQTPVQYNFKDLMLSSDPNPLLASNFPDAPVANAFKVATTGSIVAGNSTVDFTAYARLLSIDKIQDGYTGVTKVVQTWQITSTATIKGVRKSTVEVSAILDSDKVPTIAYGAFGTDPGCGSLKFQGNVSTNSYDSSLPLPMGNTTPLLFNTGGDIGTNGNLDIQGSVDVKGNLSSPIEGVGNCTNNGLGVASVAETTSGKAKVEGGAPLKLPQTLQLPTPPIPPPSPVFDPAAPLGPHSPMSITNPNGTTCATIGLLPTQCSVSGDTITLKNDSGNPLSLPFLQLGGQTKLVLTASSNAGITNEYYFNGLILQSSNQVVNIDTPSKAHDVKINFSGKYPDGTEIVGPVLDMSGGAMVGGYNTCAANDCSQFDASLLQFIYGGTGEVKVVGNPNAGAVYYMPNAYVNFGGTASLYGAIIAKDLFINGGGGNNNISINYDQNLSGKGQTASAPMLASFSWKKY